MAGSSTPSRLETAAQKARFFLEHGKAAWAIGEFEGVHGQERAELAASTIDAAASCEELFKRERDFDDWVDAAMALNPADWARFAEPWARALAAFSRCEDVLGVAFLEDVMACAPVSIQALPMEGGTVRSWLGDNLSTLHGDWAAALDQLAAIKHRPAGSLKELPGEAFHISTALSSLCSMLYREMAVSDYDCGDAMNIISRTNHEERPILALSILFTICHRCLDNPGEDEYEDMLGHCMEEALKTTPAMRRALGNDWLYALEALDALGTAEARAAFDELAVGLDGPILDTSFGNRTTWRENFLQRGGKLADLVREADAMAERATLLARDESGSPLEEIFRAAKAAPKRRPGL